MNLAEYISKQAKVKLEPGDVQIYMNGELIATMQSLRTTRAARLFTLGSASTGISLWSAE